MIFARIFLSHFFAAACLFRGLSGFTVWQTENDDDVQIKLYQTADKSEQWNAIFFVNTDNYDLIINELASTYENILFFKVDKSNCPYTVQDFGINTWPSVIFRRLGNNEVTLVSPNLFALKGGVLENKLKEYAVYAKGIEEVTIYKKFRSKLSVADIDNLLVIIYIVLNEDCDDIEPYIETVAQLYRSSIKVYKINSSIWTLAEDEYWESVQSHHDTCATIVYRKFGKNRHRLFGYNWSEFYKLLLDHKDLREKDYLNHALPGETIIVDENEKNSDGLVQHAKNDNDFSLKLEAAGDANKVIILYVVDNDNYRGVDKSVEVLAKVYPAICIIKVNTATYKGVAKKYPVDDTVEIVSFPAFIIRKYVLNLAKIVGFNAKDLRFHLNNY